MLRVHLLCCVVVFQIPCVIEMMWHLSFSAWFISFSILPSRSAPVVANGNLRFLSLYGYYSIVYMCHSFLIHPPRDGHVGHVHSRAIVSNAAMNIGVWVSFQISVFISFGPLP